MITKEEYINARNIMIAYKEQLEKELLNVKKDIDLIEPSLLLRNYIVTQPLVTKNTIKNGISVRIYNTLKKDSEYLGISQEPTVLDLARVSISDFKKLHGINKKSIDALERFAKKMDIKLLP